jgi:pimeloyl-ACP methyl ester carboxylesterase
MAYRSEIVSVGETRTHLIRGGRGKPLVILHPEFGAGKWFPYHERLAARFQVFAPDHPGFGKSERPDWLRDIDDIVFHYVELLDVLKLDRVFLAGTSVGGWIAAELAIARPDRIERLVLAAAAGIKVEGVDRFDVFIHPIEETLLHLFHDPSRAAQLLPTTPSTEVIVQAYREAGSLARLAWNPYLFNPKLERRLRRISAPTLVIWGEDDRFLPVEHAHVFASKIPAARLHLVAGCGHLVPFEKTEEFVRQVSAFLDDDRA